MSGCTLQISGLFTFICLHGSCFLLQCKLHESRNLDFPAYSSVQHIAGLRKYLLIEWMKKEPCQPWGKLDFTPGAVGRAQLLISSEDCEKI